MNKFTTVPEVRAWANDLINSEHSRYQDICDELAILEVLQARLHPHKAYVNVVDWLKDLKGLEKHEAMLMAEVSFIRRNKRKPDNEEELFEFCLLLEKEELEEEAKKKEHYAKIGGLIGLDPEKLEEMLTGSEIDKDGNCGHNREILAMMAPNFEIINEMLNGKGA